jgi:hypothetical protein
VQNGEFCDKERLLLLRHHSPAARSAATTHLVCCHNADRHDSKRRSSHSLAISFLRDIAEVSDNQLGNIDDQK